MRSALLFVTIVLLWLTSACPCFGQEKKIHALEPKPAAITTIEKVAAGRTFRSDEVRPVTFTLTPIKAFFTVSF
jgi:hypothetical protein